MHWQPIIQLSRALIILADRLIREDGRELAHRQRSRIVQHHVPPSLPDSTTTLKKLLPFKRDRPRLHFGTPLRKGQNAGA